MCERDAFDSSRPVKLLTILKTVIKLKRLHDDDNCSIIKLIRLTIMIMIMIMIMITLIIIFCGAFTVVWPLREFTQFMCDECACRWSASDEVNRLVL